MSLPTTSTISISITSIHIKILRGIPLNVRHFFSIHSLWNNPHVKFIIFEFQSNRVEWVCAMQWIDRINWMGQWRKQKMQRTKYLSDNKQVQMIFAARVNYVINRYWLFAFFAYTKQTKKHFIQINEHFELAAIK